MMMDNISTVLDSLTPMIHNMIRRKFYWFTSKYYDLKNDLVQVAYLSFFRAYPLFDETKAKLSILSFVKNETAKIEKYNDEESKIKTNVGQGGPVNTADVLEQLKQMREQAEKQLEETTKLYDAIVLNDIWAFIEDKIPGAELDYIWDSILALAREITNYNHSALGIVKSITSTPNTEELDVQNMLKELVEVSESP